LSFALIARWLGVPVDELFAGIIFKVRSEHQSVVIRLLNYPLGKQGWFLMC